MSSRIGIGESTVSQNRTSLENYNSELVRCIEDIRHKREEIHSVIAQEENEKRQIQKEIHSLTERLHKLNDSIAQKVKTRSEFDRTIQETESAFMKIIESSQTLLHVLKKESSSLMDGTRLGAL